MYNENLKTKFVQGYTNSINTANVCQTIFNAFEKYELQWGADLCTRSAEELFPVIEQLVGFRAKSHWMRIIILKDYVRWCMATGVSGACDGMLHVRVIGLDKVRQQTLASPAHLEAYLNAICEPTEECTADNIFRCYYWLAYAGLKEEDIMSVTGKNIDFKNMVIKCNGTEFPIYREAVPALKNCIELTQFVYKHPNYSTDIWRDRAPGKTLMRGIGSQSSIKAFRVALSRRSKREREEGRTDIKLSFYRAWISGVFHRAYEKEQIGIEPDFYGIVCIEKGDKVYKLDSGRNTQEAKKRQLASDYQEDYQRWKLAYKK